PYTTLFRSQRVCAEDFFEVGDDRDGAAFAQQDRFVTESLFERAQRGVCQRSGGRNKIRFASVTALDGDAHRWRAETFQVPCNEFVDAPRRLVRHKAKSEFRSRPRGDDRLAAFALVTAGESVDLKRRPRGALFLRGVAALAE